MSTYYSYYIGYMKGGRVYPLGPFTYFHEFVPVSSKSNSFASDLYREFWDLPTSKMSKDLKACFTYKEPYSDKAEIADLKYLPWSNFPNESPIKSGYFLIEDVESYEKDHVIGDLFYDSISPIAYNAMASNEVRFGKNPPKKDEFGEEYYPKNASDYMFYAYYDYNSRGDEIKKIRTAVDILVDYQHVTEKDIVIILNIG